MSFTWSLRGEILAVAHRWYLIILLGLVGAALGIGASRIWPAPYQATEELSVELNIYRWEMDRNVVQFTDNMEFNNPDDYKNWQMSNLDVLVTSDDVIRETSNRLRQLDPAYWSNVSRGRLRKDLHVYWRNAGLWRLVAENQDPKHAVQAVSVWRDVILEFLKSAVIQSQNTMMVDARLQSIAASQTQRVLRLSQLNQLAKRLTNWETDLAKLPADQALPELQRWRLVSGVSGVSNLTSLWDELLKAVPPSNALPAEYQTWIERLQTSIEEETVNIQGEIQELEQVRSDLAVQYATASKKSRGFSANLEVNKLSNNPPRVVIVRSTSLLALLGAILGILAWMALWLIQVTRKMRS